tara:strand:+ start:1931 stop:2077 length:147 start_codon:yes stop_codon:yes gene_type:complete
MKSQNDISLNLINIQEVGQKISENVSIIPPTGSGVHFNSININSLNEE